MAPSPRISPRLAAAAAVAAAVALALLALAGEQARAGERAAVLARLAAAPLPAERLASLERHTRWEDDPTQLRLDLARLLVNDALTTQPADAAEAEAVLARLDLARGFAAEAYARRPAAWRGPTLLGAATYLGRAMRRDRRLVTEATAWDEPLAWARELVPGNAEPSRFTALAYLELWPALSAEKRRAAVPLLRRAFEDPRFFGRLLDPWLRVAEDRETALAAIPPRPSDWRALTTRYAASGDWEGFLAAREGWRRAVETTLESDLEAARRMRRRGNAWEARQTCLRVIADAPTEARFLPLVQRALEEAPAGPAPTALTAPLRRWLDWVLALSLVGETPLPADALTRLAGTVADLPPAQAAHAAVAAGRLADGERLERRARAAGDTAWSGYLVAKAGALTARGHADEAMRALSEVPASWRRRPPYLAARAAAARGAGADETAARAENLLAERAAEPGGAGRWLAGPPPSLELVVAADAAGLRIEGTRRGGRASLVEVRVDGAVAAAVRLGRRLRLTVATPLAPGLHLLEVDSVAGDPFLPTAVRVTGAAAQGASPGGGTADGGEGEGDGG